MTVANYLKQNFHGSFLNSTFSFFKQHFGVIMGLGLVAGFGRVIQLGGFGVVSPLAHTLLELVIESARLILVFYVLGLANIKNGLSRLSRFFTQNQSRKLLWSSGIQKFKTQWRLILINMAGFFLVAWAINYVIDLIAYQTCLYLALKQRVYCRQHRLNGQYCYSLKTCR